MEKRKHESISNKISITIKGRTRSEEFRVDHYSRVGDLRPLIAHRFNIDRRQLRLLHAGRLLRDNDTLHDHDIRNGSAIQLVLNLNSSGDNPRCTRSTTGKLGLNKNHQNYNKPQWQIINELVSNILDSPSGLRMIVQLNPKVRETVDQNIEAKRSFREPDVLQKFMSVIFSHTPSTEYIHPGFLHNKKNLAGLPVPDKVEANSSWIVHKGAIYRQRLDKTGQPLMSKDSTVSTKSSVSSTSTSTDFSEKDSACNLACPCPSRVDFAENIGPGLRNYMEQLRNQPPQMAIPPPEVRYESQLSQLARMGYNNQETNMRALLRTFGDLNAAVEILAGKK